MESIWVPYRDDMDPGTWAIVFCLQIELAGSWIRTGDAGTQGNTSGWNVGTSNGGLTYCASPASQGANNNLSKNFTLSLHILPSYFSLDCRVQRNHFMLYGFNYKMLVYLSNLLASDAKVQTQLGMPTPHINVLRSDSHICFQFYFLKLGAPRVALSDVTTYWSLTCGSPRLRFSLLVLVSPTLGTVLTKFIKSNLSIIIIINKIIIGHLAKRLHFISK